MLTLGQTPSIPVVSKVPTIILGIGALFSFPEQSDVPSMILSSKPVSDKVDDGIMKEALLDFYTSSGKRKPDQIIIFRDGQRSPNNVLHGTVIDNKLCHPKNNDFYLGTHAGMIGIRRQTHYHVLLDQAGFSADDLQEFVHSLSYIKGAPQPYLLWLLFATLIWQLHSWGQFMKIRDASETSSSHGGMYALGVISVPQLSRLKDKVSNFILVC
ncbi:hypothetical protein GOBAR_AA07607 [Gossypium barbadense]|uniref:Piwi domain-containing protein n=1 Tax=Gossypium barbadense TaxID=3634 RepID=A0A2P5YBS8_GOSBA|nr:hypothetical protein GOBAR_AA07607 [Gossypium barbadense]